MKKPDIRPICTCGAYRFPHKLNGGSCSGEEFAEYHWVYHRRDCEFCNLNCDTYCDTYCDAATGAESVKHGQCYEDSKGCGQIEFITDQ